MMRAMAGSIRSTSRKVPKHAAAEAPARDGVGGGQAHQQRGHHAQVEMVRLFMK